MFLRFTSFFSALDFIFNKGIMTIRTYQGVSYLTGESFNQCGVVHGFFMRHGGCSPSPWKSLNMATTVGDSQDNVAQNRLRIAESLSINHDQFYDVWQVHGNKIVLTDKPRSAGKNHIQADAIATDREDVYLLMLFADCVPIMVYDCRKRVVGIAHAGWKGTLNNVVGRLIWHMQEAYGSEPKDICALIGPSICRDHYQVGREIAKPFHNKFKEEALISKDGKFFIDLRLANMIHLKKEGVLHIEMLDVCTFCKNDDWFSHRAEKGRTGRFAAVIGLPK